MGAILDSIAAKREAFRKEYGVKPSDIEINEREYMYLRREMPHTKAPCKLVTTNQILGMNIVVKNQGPIIVKNERALIGTLFPIFPAE